MSANHIELKPFTWIHPQGLFVNRCDIDIYMFKNRAVVIATEREDDPDSGMNITKGSNFIATNISHKYGLIPEMTTWIEHYPKRQRNDVQLEESYEIVEFEIDQKGLTSHKRIRIHENAVRALIKS